MSSFSRGIGSDRSSSDDEEAFAAANLNENKLPGTIVTDTNPSIVISENDSGTASRSALGATSKPVASSSQNRFAPHLESPVRQSTRQAPLPAGSQVSTLVSVTGPVSISDSAGNETSQKTLSSIDSADSAKQVFDAQLKQQETTGSKPEKLGAMTAETAMSSGDDTRSPFALSSGSSSPSSSREAASHENAKVKSAAESSSNAGVISSGHPGAVDAIAVAAPIYESGYQLIANQASGHPDERTTEGLSSSTVTVPGASSLAVSELKNIYSELPNPSAASTVKSLATHGTLHATSISGTQAESSGTPKTLSAAENHESSQSLDTQGTASGNQETVSRGSANTSSAGTSIAPKTSEVQKPSNAGQSKFESALKTSARATGSAAGTEQSSSASQPANASSLSGSGQSRNQTEAPMQGQISNVTQSGSTTMIQAPTTATAVHGTSLSSPQAAAHGETVAANSGTPFDGIDNGYSNANAGWLHASSHQVEAGYHDPTLGWVEVRASAGAGGVHATLIPSTANAADTLGQHLAGITNYLSERETPVVALSVSNSSSQGNDSSLGQGSGSGQQDASQRPLNAHDQGGGSEGARRQAEDAALNAGNASVINGLPTGLSGSLGASYDSSAARSRISVMA